MTEEMPDFQLTGDDPMLEQIEAATRKPAKREEPAASTVSPRPEQGEKKS
jgi:hypothetical protein